MTGTVFGRSVGKIRYAKYCAKPGTIWLSEKQHVTLRGPA